MTLQGIIIRADGVIAETDGLERSVLNKVIQSAGFTWTCTREAFAALRQYPRRRDRYRQFVRQNLGHDRSSEDFERLIDVMTRHSGTVARELIDKDYLDPRPGARELASAARQEGIKIAIVSALPRGEAEHLMAHLFGEGSKRLISCITAPDAETAKKACSRSTSRRSKSSVSTRHPASRSKRHRMAPRPHATPASLPSFCSATMNQAKTCFSRSTS